MKVFVVACALFSVAIAHTVPTAQQSYLQECFEKDSIACVQQTVRIITTTTTKYPQTNFKPFSNDLSIESVSFEWIEIKVTNALPNQSWINKCKWFKLNAKIEECIKI